MKYAFASKYAYASGSDSEDDEQEEDKSLLVVPKLPQPQAKLVSKPTLVSWDCIESRVQSKFNRKATTSSFLKSMAQFDTDKVQTCFYALVFAGLTANLLLDPFGW